MKNIPKEKSSSLETLRRELDIIDNNILKMVVERAQLAAKIYEAKKSDNSFVYQPVREAEILRKLNSSDLSPLDITKVWDIWRTMINANISLQSTLRIHVWDKKETNADILSYFGPDVEVHELPVASDESIERKPIEDAMLNNPQSNIIVIPFSRWDSDYSIGGKIIGAFPMISRDTPKYFVVGKNNFLKSSDDITLFSVVFNNWNIEIPKEFDDNKDDYEWVSRWFSDLKKQMQKKLEIDVEIEYLIPNPGVKKYLIGVKGYFDESSQFIKSLSANDSIQSIELKGIYPNILVYNKGK
jgi:chorismate mutase